MQSVCIATKVRSNPTHDEIKFVYSFIICLFQEKYVVVLTVEQSVIIHIVLKLVSIHISLL